MEVRFFGEFEVLEEGVPVPVRGAKQRALLAILALRRGNPVSADRLIDVLWAASKVANPANALQVQIGQLRRTLGAGAIVTSEAGYTLAVGPDDLDAARFEHLVTEGRRLSDEGEMGLASTVLGEALRLRRGEPLVEFAYAGFADAERAHLDELTLVATEVRVAVDLALGRHGELVGELEALCREHPLRERLWELLMLALYRAGRQAEALRACTEVRDRLVDELGIDPSSALRELEARILVQDPSLDLPAPPQLRPVAAPMVRGNLRERLSRFVGRHAELEQLNQAVRASRLVTLTGPGGVGKTRLALEAAASLQDQYPDGAWLVELATVTEPEAVAPAAAAALGASASAVGGPGPPGSTEELIVRHLSGRSLVVVLDNCEHLIDEAAALADTLVGAVPGLRLIATSREALGVPGEVVMTVAGLPTPPAVELFVDRARAVQPGFASDGAAQHAIEDLCRRLDGLPLAIELAAARLRALPLSTLAERLDDRFRILTGGARTALPRQQTLRAVVDWSYDLLFEDERRLFARLSVFVGGFDLDAAEDVCADAQVPKGEILDVLSRLVDKSLVAAPVVGHEARFTQLQMLWDYGRERLEEWGESQVLHARHSAHYRRMAEESHAGLRGATGPRWRDRLTSNAGNLRAALDWYIDTGDADAALSLVSGMAWLWFINGNVVEGERWVGDALRARGPRRRELEATAQVWHGHCVGMSSSPAAGAAECEDAIAVLRASGGGEALAEALVPYSTVLGFAHQFARSLEALREARDLLEPALHGWLLAAHDLMVAWNLLALGRPEEAERAARSSLEAFDVEGEVLVVVSALNALASIAEARGDLDAASAAYEELLERCRDTEQPLHVPLSLAALAALRAREGDDHAADRLYEEAIGRSFNPWLSADSMIGQAAVARRLGDLARAGALLEAAASLYRHIELPAGPPRVLVGLAWWALAAGHPDDAVAFAAEAAQAATASGDPATELLANTAMAAVKAVAAPTPHNVQAFVALAQQRSVGPGYRSLTDEPDVAELLARIGGG
jgi:predicted ATPase